jgi:hypothetical protein
VSKPQSRKSAAISERKNDGAIKCRLKTYEGFIEGPAWLHKAL